MELDGGYLGRDNNVEVWSGDGNNINGMLLGGWGSVGGGGL